MKETISSLKSKQEKKGMVIREVAQILVDLPKMIETFESMTPSFKWGLKRRRSALLLDKKISSNSTNSFSCQEENFNTGMMMGNLNNPKIISAAVSNSPVTPLSFPTESSDDNNNSKIKSREEYVDMVEELTQRRDLLKGEVQNVTNYHNKLTAYNSQLKSMKQEVLKSCHKKNGPQLDLSMNIGVEFTQHHQTPIVAHHQPHVVDRMAGNYRYIGPITAQYYSSNNGPVNSVGPLGIPDLNLSAEEVFVLDPSQPLDVSRRAGFAEARRRRKGIIKIKSMRSACGIKMSGNR